MFAGRNMLFTMGAAGSSSTPEGATLTVYWDDNSDIEDGFRVRYRTAGSGSYTLATTTAANIETATLYGLEYGTSYDVTVAAFNTSGEYSVVGPVTRYTIPEFAPTSITAGTITADSIPVSFTATTPTPTGYQSRYKTTAGSVWTNGPTASASPITFTGLDSETGYDLQVRAYFANSGQSDSLGPWSASLTISTAVEPVTTDYIDTIRALSLPPMVHWPMISNATASNPSNPDLAAYFNGTSSNVTYGQKSVIYGAGKSAVFGPTSEVSIPNGWEIEDICALVTWVEFLTVPTGYVRIIDQIAGWGIAVDGGKIRGFVNGTGYFGGETFTIETKVKYCVSVIRKASGAWTLYVNGVEGGFTINNTPTAFTTSKIGSSGNHASTSFRLHHASLHYNGTVAPDSTWAAAIYAARL